MKLSKIIDELTKLKEHIGDKDLNECTVTDWTSTSLEGEKMEKMGNLAYLNAKAKLAEVYGDEEGARRAAIKKE